MTTHPAWFYNEFQQIGTDFEDRAYVETYDRNQHSSTLEAEQQLVAQLAIGPGQTVIDLGCGTGTFAIQAARAGDHVQAIDISQRMLTYAQQKAEAAQVQHAIQFHHSGLLSYEHTGIAADVIVSKSTLHHLPDFWKMAAFLRIAAMLKPNGVFHLRDTVFSFDPTEYQTQIDAWIKRVAKPINEDWTAADFETHVREEYMTFAWIIERMLTNAGFIIESADYPTTEYAIYLCRKHN